MTILRWCGRGVVWGFGTIGLGIMLVAAWIDNKVEGRP